MVCGFRSVLCVSVFQGSLLMIVIRGGSRPPDTVGGDQSSRPLDKGGGEGGGLRKIFFRPFEPQFDPPLVIMIEDNVACEQALLFGRAK